MLLKVFVVKNTVYRVIDWGICSVKIIEVKVPITNFFLFSHPNIHIKQWCWPKKLVDSGEMRFFLSFFKSSKFAAILFHHSHLSPLGLTGAVT